MYYELSLPNPNGISLAGSGAIVADALVIDNLNLALIGAGSMRLTGLKATALSSSVVGEGKMELAGEALSHMVSVVNNNRLATVSYDATELKSDYVSLETRGSAELSFCALKELSYQTTALAKIRYNSEASLNQRAGSEASLFAMGPCGP
ncbi:MAG: DUF2807 domain-containing protein [Deinococcales bacterium]